MSDFIAAYLFLGGTGAAAFLCAVLLRLLSRSGQADFRDIKYLTAEAKCIFMLSFLFVSLGCLCLLIDLGRPDRALLLFLNPTFSYISIGSFCLAALLAITLAVFALDYVSNKTRKKIQTVLFVLGCICALYIMVYTGLLLMLAEGVDLWASPTLVFLFFFSSLSGGVALTTFVLGTHPSCSKLITQLKRRFVALGVILPLFEVVFCVPHLWLVSNTELGAQCVNNLLTGSLSVMFLGGFLVCGIILPIIFDAYTLKACKVHAVYSMNSNLNVLTSLFVLTGGFLLRLALVRGGVCFVMS